MEIGKSQIARLVLGYLKSEDCMNAFNEFLTTSKYLERHAPFVKNGKYFSTRVGGLTLIDIITEYSEISCLVEGKLEQTNYYEEHHKMNLVNQLMYIFDNYCQPPPVTPILSKGLNATPSESLPGNSSWKSTSKDSSSHATSTFEEGSLGDHANISQISQALLEKSELHEKLADAINSVCKSSQGADISGENTFVELDNKIKTIVQKAEQDPIFDQILDEIIGSNVIPTSEINSPSINFNIPRSLNMMKNQMDESPQRTKSVGVEDTSLKAVNTSTPKVDSDVIVYSGNLESYVGNAATLVQPQQQNQIYLTPSGMNSAGLLMVPSMITAPNYFILNNQPNSTAIMSDNDIMKMPTIILNDAGITGQKETAQTSQKAIAPRCDSITVSTQCGDYLAVYKDDGEVIVTNSKIDKEEPLKKEEPAKKKQSGKSRQGLGLRKKLPRQVKLKMDTNLGLEKQGTPCTKTNNKKTTPKSGSHVRTLNFTTPQKDGEQNITEKDESFKKNASKILFKDEKKGNSQNDVKTKKSSWDADLRELLIPQKIPIVSPDTSTDDVNLTCEDEELQNNAKLIEEAFQSPLKTNTSNHALDGNNIPDNVNEAEQKNTEKVKTDDSLELEDENSQKEKATVEKITVEETELYLRNCNGPQRFKKKCNITNNIVHEYDVDVVIETEQQATYVTDETVKALSKSHNNKTPSGNRKELVLETPIKFLPKTPGKCELTPFSKALEEHLQGMDLLAMPTPNLPITPSYPITPSIAMNTPLHVNRPTDYSTSSSYYQPSDTEQNKSLELMIEECKKLEKREIERYHIETRDENPVSDQTGIAISNISEIKRIFNENVVGKKNLSLITDRNSSSDSEPSNSSSNATSSSSSDSDSEYDPREEIRTVIKKETYCLRNRISTPKIDSRKANRLSSTKTPAKPASKDNTDKNHEQRNSKNRKFTQTPSQVREKSTRTVKKPIVRRKSCTSSEKNSVKTNEQIAKILEAENEITDDDITLHLSTDEESVNRPTTETIKHKEVASEKAPEKESPSDFEAEQLVQGLRERGIHLMHKKSPKKSSEMVHIGLRNEEHPKIEINQVILKNEELENEKNEVEILSSKSANSSVNTINNDSEMSFDIICFEKEHFKIDFNYNKRKPKKKITNAKFLEKKMKATVYIETLDTEVERVIECTPFEAFFEFIPKNNSRSKKTDNADCPKKLLATSSIINEEKNSKNKQKEKVDGPAKKPVNVNKRQCKGEVKKTTTCEQEISEPKILENKCSKSNSLSEGCKNVRKTELEKTKKNIKKAENDKLIKNDIKSKCNSSDTKINDCFVVLNDNVTSAINKTVEEKTFDLSDDDLMNYAAIGSHREENLESPRSGDKRKHSNLQDTEPNGKKCKTEKQQALLKKIDVDMFLNKVHGNLGKP